MSKLKNKRDVVAILTNYGRSGISAWYRGCFERIYVFSPSINVDDGWKPVKKYIQETTDTDREKVYFEDWDEAALRRIIAQQRKITQKSKELGMKRLYQILVVIDDFADSPHLHKRTGDAALDTLFVRGRHFQITTIVSTQKLRLISNAVRVNSQFFCIWRLRNQLEKDSLLEELTALLPKADLEAMYEEAVREPFSFLYIYLLNPREKMFHIRFERALGAVFGKLFASSTLFNSECKNVSCCSSNALPHNYDPNRPPWMQRLPEPMAGHPLKQQRSFSDNSNDAVLRGQRMQRAAYNKLKLMTSIWVDSRKRMAGSDADFEFDIGQTVHLQGSARLSVFKIRVADTFLSTDRGTYLYWEDQALGTLNWAQLAVGAYTGARLAAWISSNFASATYVESTNEITGATPSAPQSINHLLGPSFVSGGSQIFTFVQMMPYSELYLRCSSLSNAADTVGPLGHDIVAKIICNRGVGHIMESSTDENHLVNIRGPITLRYLRFRLTDVDGNTVNLRGTSISFCIYLEVAGEAQEGERVAEPEELPVEHPDVPSPVKKEPSLPSPAQLRHMRMMRIEPRNERQMLHQFWKRYPAYNLNALMRKRYEELMDARAFNEFLRDRQLRQQGDAYVDAVGRVQEAVNRRIPQLRWTVAERNQVRRVLAYINEGEPLKMALPNRRASRPHTQLGAAVEEEFASADDGYEGRPFPQVQRPNFLGPGPDTDDSGPDEAFRRDGFDAPRPPQASSSVSGRFAEAAARGGGAIIAAGAAGVGRSVENFGFRNATRAVDVIERRVAPTIIGRPSQAEELITRAGQRAQEAERAAAADIEEFAAQQAAAEGGEMTPLLAEAGTQTAAAAAEGGAALAGLSAFGGAAVEGAGEAAAMAFPLAEGLGMAAGVATGGAAALAGGAAYGLYRGGRWLLGGNDASSSESVPAVDIHAVDIRTLNNMQQGSPQEHISLRQPARSRPVVHYDIAAGDSDEPAQQQPAPQVRSTPSNMPWGINPVGQPRRQRARLRPPPAEPTFGELRREALAHEPEVTNAVNDELISSLDYKMRTSNASYVTSRKDVQFFPSSLSTFTSTTSRVARIPLTTGGDFLDPESIKIAFRFVNNDATNDFHPLTGHPGCLVKRIQLFANGQRTDDIDHYGRNVHMYTLLKP
ncbi:unnamed protein product, partial [Symbiodinium sp. CCMP2456]